MLRMRKDKPAGEADTVDSALELLEAHTRGCVRWRDLTGVPRRQSIAGCAPSRAETCCGSPQPFGLSGGAWPAAAARTFKLLFVAGYGGPPPNQSIRSGVVAALARRGFVEGRNLELVFTDAWIPGKAGGKEAALAAAVARRPDAILTQNTEITRAMQAATRSIPIVFWNVADPVASGIVPNLARPGGKHDRRLGP
jgi:hypothetical protein